MKVKIEIAKEYDPAYAVIYTTAVTEEIQKVSDFLHLFHRDNSDYSPKGLTFLPKRHIIWEQKVANGRKRPELSERKSS